MIRALRHLLLLSSFFCFLTLSAARCRIVGTTDTHGAWRSTPEANWLKLAHAINALPDDPPKILIDCGDTISGSREAAESDFTLGILALNQLRFDLWVPGNHDFDAGTGHLVRMTEFFNGTVLSANFRGDRIVPWEIVSAGGFEIAFIGLLTPLTVNFRLFPEGVPEIMPEKESVDRAMRELRASGRHFDFAVLAMHRGRFTSGEKLYDILRGNPEIKLVLGGHSHVVEEAAQVRGALFAAAGAHCGGFLDIDVAAPDEKRNSPVLTVTYREIGDCPEDEAFAAAIEKTLKLKTEAELSRPVGVFSSPLEMASSGRAAGSFADMKLRAMLLDEAPGSVALTMLSTRKRAPIPPEITEAGLFDLCPYQDSVVRFEVSQPELIAIIDDLLKRGKKRREVPVLKGIRAFRDAAGAFVSISPAQDRYTLVMSDFEAAGSGAAETVTAAVLRDKPFEIRGSLRDKIRELLSRSPVVTVKASPWLFRQK